MLLAPDVTGAPCNGSSNQVVTGQRRAASRPRQRQNVDVAKEAATPLQERPNVVHGMGLSIEHETWLLLFRNRPTLALELLRDTLGIAVQAAEPRAMLYFDLIHTALGHAARKAIDAMISEGYKFKSQFAKRYIAEGEAKGLAEGEAKGEAKAVIAVLEARGLSLTDEERAQIQGCTDLGRLDSWVRRAVHVERAGELFERDG
ncbi:MAG TPA: hypothetical protein VGP93_14450 [Polyangiaceae bacterium]|jgi:hypothetical protein|nr:hypothetical protein [Polyangiaceae bacterium]